MASKRPGYSRYDTDQNSVPLSDVQPGPASPKKDWQDDEASIGKGETKAKVSSYDGGESPPPAFEVEDENHFGQADVVHTVCTILPDNDW